MARGGLRSKHMVGTAARLARRVLLPLLMFAMMCVLPSLAAARLPQRIVAVGDLHGDYSAWLDIARDAGLIDARGHWAGGRTILVQLGDVVDRQPDSLKIIRSLQELQKEAPRAGGRVVALIGNHEAMNLLGDNRYTTAGEYAAFAGPHSAAVRDRVYDRNRAAIEKAAQAANPALTPQQSRDEWMAKHPLGWAEHRVAWSPSGELGKWAAGNPAVVKIGDTLFVHGGLSAEYAKLSLNEINRRAAQAMKSADDRDDSILNDPLGPLWYRGLVTNDADADAARAAMKPPSPHLAVDQELDAVLSAYGASRIVVGHTPDLKGIEISHGGRLARIDTGNSRFYGGPLSWLKIAGGRMIPHTVRRSVP